MILNKYVLLSLTILILSSCGDDEFYIPKPTVNLRMEFPEHEYTRFSDDCPYSFELASYMTSSPTSDANSCHKDISLGNFNGIIHLSYIKIDTALSAYIDYSIQKVQEHIVKAAAIDDINIVIPEQRIFGTFFEIQGNAASPFQFYYTDSVNHFIRGAVYFNSKPNYDSIYPVLEYVKTDLIHMMESTEWKTK